MALAFNPLARETSFDFLGLRKITLAFSAFLVLASMILLVVPGLNLGVDFLGGTEVITPIPEGETLDSLQDKIQASHPFLADVDVQAFGANARFIMPVPEEAEHIGVSQLKFLEFRRDQALESIGLVYDEGSIGYESVGGEFSNELRNRAILSVLIAIFAIGAYIAVRFEWRFSVAAIVALLHDAVTTVGLFALLGLEVNLAVVAAVLTIAGYSINDTVVVFDRIREEMRRSPEEPLLAILNRSLNRTLSRTLMTSVTTLLALFMLFIFAGADIREFSVALIWGVAIGTYSSLFLATPLLTLMGLSSKVFERKQIDVGGMEDSALAWAASLEDTSVETLEGETLDEGTAPKRAKGKTRKGKKRR